jgi:hypothetical protein
MSHLGVFSKPAATATAVKAASAIRREIRARLTFGSGCCRVEGSVAHAENFHLNLYFVQFARYVSKHGKTSSRGKFTLLNQGRYVCDLPRPDLNSKFSTE